LHSREARGRISRVAVAEQPLEYGTRVVTQRQRVGGRPPAQGIDVRAAETGIAGTGHAGDFETDLERRELSVLTELPGRDLIDRDACLEVGPFGRLAVHARQERAADAAMPSCRLAEPCDRRFVVEARQHGEAIAKRLERLEYP